MKPSAVFTVLAFGNCLGKATAASESSGLPDLAYASILEKRDAFTCYGSTNTSVSDCQTIIDTIRTDAQQQYTLYSNICAVWDQGTCRVRLCAQPYVTRPVNRTATWLTTYVASPMLDDCISQGKMGVISDHPNINSHAGTYRLWVS
ncbi:hypothetical protein F4819DRAFT_108566 [Hypoxylon fuscum]|nr:hypothetical protein F4819DRAFT_108566 [Hypoxylon fuscum]